MSDPPTPDKPDPTEPPPTPGQPVQPTPIPPALLAQLLAQRAAMPYIGIPQIGMPIGQMGFPVAVPQAQQQAQIQLWQGQFPPPDAVQKYEEVLSGSFNRMISMAENLQEAQIAEVKRAHDYTAIDTKRGHWLGFSVTAMSVVGAVVCAIVASVTHESGPYWVAGLLVSVPVMSVAKALIESVVSKSPASMTIPAASSPEAPPIPQPPAPIPTPSLSQLPITAPNPTNAGAPSPALCCAPLAIRRLSSFHATSPA